MKNHVNIERCLESLLEILNGNLVANYCDKRSTNEVIKQSCQTFVSFMYIIIIYELYE